MADNPYQGKHFVVIGGTQGLGLAIAEAATRRGATVTVSGRNEERNAAAAERLGEGAAGLHCDLNDFASLDRLFAQIDRVDHLILAALDRDHNKLSDRWCSSPACRCGCRCPARRPSRWRTPG